MPQEFYLFKDIAQFMIEMLLIPNASWIHLTLMREVQTIAPALTMGLCGLSVEDNEK